MQWLKSMKLIDANVILRCILDDHPEMSVKAKEIISQGVYTKPEIIAEVVYVLQKVYSVQRPQIKQFALDLYAGTSLDFVDCLLGAYHSLNGEETFTFDRKLNKLLNTL